MSSSVGMAPQDSAERARFENELQRILSASAKAVSGVFSDGLRTKALPIASAGADFHAAIWIG